MPKLDENFVKSLLKQDLHSLINNLMIPYYRPLSNFLIY